MFLFFYYRRKRTSARVVGAGKFFCLYCETDRAYELREYQSTTGAEGGMFVLCGACGTAFDPECLDESSTGDLRELEVDVPGEALEALAPWNRYEVSAPESLDQYLGRDGDGAGDEAGSASRPRSVVSQGSAPAPAAGSRRSSSGRSQGRRH